MIGNFPAWATARDIARANPDVPAPLVMAAAEFLHGQGEALRDGKVLAEARRRLPAHEKWVALRAELDPTLNDVQRMRFDQLAPVAIDRGYLLLDGGDRFVARRYGRLLRRLAATHGLAGVVIAGQTLKAAVAA